MTQEFHLRITVLDTDDVYVRVDRAPAATPLAEERLHWPVNRWLDLTRNILADPLSQQGSTLATPGMAQLEGSPQPLDPLVLGRQLYQGLFQKSLAQSWEIAQGIAQHRGEILRLRLGMKDDRLLTLPWEILHDGHQPLATARSVIFSRYQTSLTTFNGFMDPVSPAQSQEKPCLRVLMVLANPNDRSHLSLKQEAMLLQGELGQAQHPGSPPTSSGEDQRFPLPIDLTILEQPGREQLTQALERGRYHIFHFSGHSSPGPEGGHLHLVNRRTGLAERLAGKDLAGLLKNNGIVLALLNSCRGHYKSTTDAAGVDFPLLVDPNPSLADVLVKAGLPAVLAMAEYIPDRVALMLTRLFYRNLKLGYPIDLSLCRARQGLLSSYGSQHLYWCLPVLYLQSDCGGQFVAPEVINQRLLEQQWLAEPPIDLSTLALDDLTSPLPQEKHPASLQMPWGSSPLPDRSSPRVPWHTPERMGGSLVPAQSRNGYDDPNHADLSHADLSHADPIPGASVHPIPPSLADLDQSLSEDDGLPVGSSVPSDDRDLTPLPQEMPVGSDAETEYLLQRLSYPHQDHEGYEEEAIVSIDEQLLPTHDESLSLYPDLPEGDWYPNASRRPVPGLQNFGHRSHQGQTHGLEEGNGGVAEFPKANPVPMASTSGVQQFEHDRHGSSVEHRHPTIELYRQTLAINPTDAQTYHKLGLSLVAAGQLEEALEAYHQALTFNPNLAEVYSSLGEALVTQGNYAQAIVAYRQALALNPQLPNVYRQLSLLLKTPGSGERDTPISSRYDSPDPDTIVPPSEPAPISPPTSETSPQPVSWSGLISRKVPLWLWLGTTGGAAVLTLTLLFLAGSQSFRMGVTDLDPSPLPEPLGRSIPNPRDEARPTQDPTHNVTLSQYARTALEQGQWDRAQEAIVALLERSDWQDVQATLDQAGATVLNRPEFSFLYGRLAWQVMQQPDGTTPVTLTAEDARRYWDQADRQQPNTPAYLNALGFAHYQGGQFHQAKQLWLQVLPLTGETEDPLFANGNPLGGRFPDNTPIPVDEALTASAGLALALFQLGQAQPVGQQSQFFNQASQLYRRVMDNNPRAFTRSALHENWLWTDAMVQDWQALGQWSGDPPPQTLP